MSVIQLASSTDVAAVLGRALTSAESARVGAILDKASELFRRRSGQKFTSGTSTVRLRVVGDVVTLTQRPVVSVQSVVDDSGEAVAYTLRGSQLVLTGLYKFVKVAYTHGGTVPDVVRLAVADIARKVLLIPEGARGGVSQFSDTTGPFTESGTYATWAVGGQTMLSPDDNALADSFRVRVPGFLVSVP
jgi:hypothetical protein